MQGAQLTSLSDAPALPPKALEMVRTLVAGHETVARTARELSPIVQKTNDRPTADLLAQRLGVHEMAAWMFTRPLGRMTPDGEEKCSIISRTPAVPDRYWGG